MKINVISREISMPQNSSAAHINKVANYNLAARKELMQDSVSFGAAPQNYVETIRAVLRKKPEKLNPDVINRFVMSVIPGKKRESSLANRKNFESMLEKGEVISRNSIKGVIDEIADAVSVVTRSRKLPQELKDKISLVVNRAAKGESLEKSELTDLRESIISVAFRSPKK